MKANRGHVRLTKRGERALLAFLFATSLLAGLTAGSWDPYTHDDVTQGDHR